MINGVYPDEKVVVYEAPKAEKKVFTNEDLYNADLFSFGSIIGQITNKSTAIYSLLENYSEDNFEHKILLDRLKMCTKLQSAQIDKTKIGREVKGIPKHWIKPNMIEGNEEFYNKLLLDKHPYFFRYLYKETDKIYKKYVGNFNNKVRNKLGITLNELLEKKVLSDKEQVMTDNYRKFIPVIDTSSVMNRVCKYIEGVKFKALERNRASNNDDEVYRMLMKNTQVDKDLLEKVENEYKRFLSKEKVVLELGLIQTMNSSIEESNYLGNKHEAFKNKLIKFSSNVYDIVDCLIYLLYVKRNTKDKNILWETFGDIVVKNLTKNLGNKLSVPCLDIHGNINYMNRHYKIKEVSINED